MTQRPIFWHQGLFLQPQHFQLEDRFIESLLTPLYQYNSPHFWGVGSSEIQESALGNRTFNLNQGDFIFPDNTRVSYPGNAIIEPRSFDADWIEGGKPLTVYVALKKYSATVNNVTILAEKYDLSEITTRYVTHKAPEDVPDCYQSGPSAEINQLYYLLKICWDTEIDKLADHTLIPIAQLVRSGEDVLLSDQYVPPCLTLNSSEVLDKLIKEIRDQITSRGHQLEAYKKERGIQTAEFGARDMVYLLAMRSLARYAPLLYHFTETRKVHPWTVYGTIRQLIGELSTFSNHLNMLAEGEDQIPLLPAYNHHDLYRCYANALGLVSQLLDEITAGPEYIIPLVYDGTYFAAEVAPKIFEAKNRYYLVFETETDPETILNSLTTIAKLSTRETLPILIARALPGIKVDHLPTPPQELPRRSNAIYFQINQHSDHWAQVAKDHNLALYWDTSPEDLKAELMVVGKS